MHRPSAPLFAAALLLVAPAAHAVLDRNHDGLSDIWQKAYPTAGADDADPDGDGFPNALEQTAGTDPLSGKSRPASTLEFDGAGNLVLRWPGLKGKRYYTTSSPDLVQWSLLGSSVAGSGDDLTKIVRAAGATTDPAFYRVNASDNDADADLLSDWEEAQLGLNPAKADSDGDGMDDFWESDHDTNPALANASADPDGDGFSNLREYAAGTDPQVRALPVPGGPVVFWASQPVAPDQTILATCAGTDLDSTAELARLPDTAPGSPLATAPAPTGWTALTPHTATPRSVTVTVPSSWTPGVYALRLKEAGATGPVHLVNRPDPWFVQGDQGDTATPGGSLTVAGTCLEIVGPGSAGPRAALVRNGAVAATLTAPTRLTTSTGYALRYTLPSALAEGDYQLYVHNGCGGPAGWVKFATFVRTPVETVTIKQASVWPTGSFTVAAPTGSDDDAKFAAALDAAAAAGGGIVHVPAGTYVLTQPLLLPRFTVLKGAGRDQTLLLWENNPQAANASLQGLVMNRNYTRDEPFALEDLAFEITHPGYRGAVV
ncbi:MAG TPA: glycosyl hydrolase family 28-related protein, partial [Opitutaceae bacterium]|nr:glycosyl hydrolase family 28-related protein [Opitutaceae bacterium]